MGIQTFREATSIAPKKKIKPDFTEWRISKKRTKQVTDKWIIKTGMKGTPING